jgi:hypothetical protein
MVQQRRERRKIASVNDKNEDGVRALTRYDLPPRKAQVAEKIAVTDDLPEDIPITQAEVDMLETFLGDVLDAFLQSRH